MADEKWHGTSGGYTNHKCRCDECRVAFNESMRKYQKRRRESYVYDPAHEHGREKTFQRGCRCVPCREDHNRQTGLRRSAPKNGASKCDICGLEGPTVWDHCHSSGQHRGWLCLNCNQSLGLFIDNPAILARAIGYLK